MKNYLSKNPEQMPDWLKNHVHGSKILFSTVLKSRILYYPGSGNDGQPVQSFVQTHSAHCFLYVDYMLERKDIEKQLGESGFLGYHLLDSIDFQESDLTPYGWTPHIHPGETNQEWLKYATKKPYCFMGIFERDNNRDDSHGSRRFAMTFLGGDGIASYDAIFCNGHVKNPPFVLVLQDHGFGGNYDRFGAGGLLERISERSNVFPEYLLVADQYTASWAGYERVPNLQSVPGGMYRTQRSLYRRCV